MLLNDSGSSSNQKDSMTPRQKRLHKLGNAMRRVKGAESNPADKNPKAIQDLGRRRFVCETHSDPIPTQF
jgi:hypothetical protein